MQALIKDGKLRQSEIVAHCKIKAPTLSRWIGETTQSWKRIETATHHRIVEYLHTKSLLPLGPSTANTIEYRGLASFYGQTDNQLKDLIANGQGHYRVFRWSNAKRGSILRGALEIRYDTALHIMTTNEAYQATIRKLPVDWPREGYFFGRGREQFALASRKYNSKEVQLMYLKKPMRRGTDGSREMVKFEGVLVDMEGDKVYKTSVIIERVSTALLPSEICDLPPTDPEIEGIAEQLSNPISFANSICLYE